MKSLKKAYQDINRQEQELDVLIKFLKTNKGRVFAQSLQSGSLDSLVKKFEAPKVRSVKAYYKQLNMWKSAIKMVKCSFEGPKILENYYENRERLDKEGALKPCPNLTKFEQKLLNKRDQWKIKKYKNGLPMIKQEEKKNPDGSSTFVMLYDKQTGLPIYKYTPKPTKMGRAYLCHQYELLKIAKWERRNPKPGTLDLRMDLFPEELKQAYNTKKRLAIESIRASLAEHYYGVKDKRPFLQVYEVGEVHACGNHVVWEQEAYHNNPFHSYNTVPIMPEMHAKLQRAINNVCHPLNGRITSLKLYDRYGNLHDQLAVA